MRRQRDFVERSRPDAVLAVLKPEQPGHAEPAVVLPEVGFALLAPLLDLGLVGRLRQ